MASRQRGSGSHRAGEDRSRSGGAGGRASRASARRSGGRASGGALREYPDYSVLDPRDVPQGPDVLLDVPTVKVDEIDIEVDELRAQVAVMAEVRDLVQLSVGVDAQLGRVELKLDGVEAQALLTARLDNVGRILERVLLSLDRNPELLQSVGKAVEDVGRGGGKLLGEAGKAAEDVGEGAEGAVQDVGRGAGRGVQQVGQGAQRGVAGAGQGARQATAALAQGGRSRG
jgi:hypothetical protein